MALSRFVAVFAWAIQASALADKCAEGECMTEESSLLVVNSPKRNMTKWFGWWGVSTCINRQGMLFPCGDGQCCGDVCKAEGDLCCVNDNGNFFPCQGGGSCCGNGCAAPGSKCCNKGRPGYEYPVSKGTACASDSITCTNSNGDSFQCGAGSSCCGDICVGPGDVCCHSMEHSFACGSGSKCCGNSCAAPGSKCCRTRGVSYPVTQATKCAGWNSGSIPCINRRGEEFLCGAGSSCCGDICAGPGSACCENQNGNDFVCAPGSRCGNNICIAK